MSSDAAAPPPLIDTAAQVERETVRLAFGTWVQYVDGLPFAVGLAFMFSGAWPAAGNTDARLAAIWVAAACLWAVFGSTVAWAYRRYESTRPLVVWQRLQYAVWMSNACVWGAVAWLFWDTGNPVNHAIVCVALLGVIVSAFFSLTMHRRVLIATLGVHLAVQWSAFVYHGETLAQVFAIVFPLFMLLLTNYGRGVAARYQQALELRFENEAMAAAVMRANRAKSDFLASMSHELRTPLNAIIGYSEMMRSGTFGPVAPMRYAEFVDNIAESGEHLLRMINDLLDLAKIESGRRDLTVVSVRLSDVAKDAMRYVEPQAARAHVSLMLDIKHDAIVLADERAVKQMIINLLSNAVKFSKPGALAVVFGDILPGERAAIGVRDTGTGMTPAMQKKALEPFGQASDAMTVEGYGTGLGLPIIKGLIEAHQGLLRIESTLGAGSRIWVEFPADRLVRRAEAA